MEKTIINICNVSYDHPITSLFKKYNIHTVSNIEV